MKFLRIETPGISHYAYLIADGGFGHRAGLGVSILLKAGFADVRNLMGGMKAWQTLELPTE